MSDLTGKVAVVTGAGGGIGYALMLALERAGAFVAAWDLKPPPEGSSRLALEVDITSEAAVKDAARAVKENFGGVDVLINNAAITDLGHHHLHDVPLDIWRQVMEVNVTGSVIVTKALLPQLARRGGNIIFITSSLGLFKSGIAGDAVYSASKAAVESLAYVLSLEVVPFGINVNTLYPSVKVDTGFFSHLTPEARAKLARPDLLNEPALFLAALLPGTLSGESVSQEAWDNVPGYAQALQERAAQARR
ncbi:MAG: SDR family NAD(P)-dependent oxidoreductase [Thermosphaera sp.]